MAGHSKFKNIMHRKGAQDKKRSAMFSKLSREITVAAKMGLPDPDMNARLRAAVIAAKAQSMPKDNIQRSIDKASRQRRRELRGNPLRGLRPRRRRDHRRGADRQPQPHRDQRPHRLLQERRQPRRERLGQPRVRAHGPDRISGAARATPTRCWKRRSRPAPTTSKVDEEGHEIWTSVDSAPRSRQGARRRARRSRSGQARLEARTEVEVRGDDAAHADEADRRARGRRRRPDRLGQLRCPRRGAGEACLKHPRPRPRARHDRLGPDPGRGQPPVPCRQRPAEDRHGRAAARAARRPCAPARGAHRRARARRPRRSRKCSSTRTRSRRSSSARRAASC